MERGRAAAFLDRDGVLSRAPVIDGVPRAATTLAELEVLPDAAAGCENLRRAGLLLICVTNQPEIARGGVRAEDVEAINDHLRAELGIDDVIVCPHDDADDCPCRKPRPGMWHEAARRHAIDLAESFTVGDRWRDIDAGHAARTRTVLVDRHYDESGGSAAPDAVVGGLEEASEWILRQLQPDP